MGFWGKLGRNVITRVIKPELNRLRDDIAEALLKSNAAVEEVKKLKRQLASLQALDIGFKEAGKVILMARVNGKDCVRIFDTKPNMTFQEYREMSTLLKHDYGADPRWIDCPNGQDMYWKLEDV